MSNHNFERVVDMLNLIIRDSCFGMKPIGKATVEKMARSALAATEGNRRSIKAACGREVGFYLGQEDAAWRARSPIEWHELDGAIREDANVKEMEAKAAKKEEAKTNEDNGEGTSRTSSVKTKSN
tara:strand:+ start:256 stop:630 length:375 start_codon:yes stop_codon:yes gene_type:complete